MGNGSARHADDVNADRPPVDTLLAALIEAGGSDLHLTVGAPPMIRVHGDLYPLRGYEPLTADDTAWLIRGLVSDAQWQRFEQDLELDLAYDIPGLSRFRVNLFQQRNSYGTVMRAIPHVIKPLHELGIPEQISQFAFLPRGLVLVTGPTGSGKTTTLASLLDLANRSRRDHIVTIEDPIEFLHQHKRCVVNQREVGVDTDGFATALKHVLRQDPDIILVGEMRDLETVSTAITAAETGHLVLATLHTQSAAQTDRPHHRHLPAAPAAGDPGAAVDLRCRASSHRRCADARTAAAEPWCARSCSPRRRSATSSARARTTRSRRSCSPPAPKGC